MEKLILEILDGKEKRALKQKTLLEMYGKTLISFTLNIPGKYKLQDRYKKVFIKGVCAIKEVLQKSNIEIIKTDLGERASGYEFFCVVNAPSKIVKELMIELEGKEPVYRLFDIDVFDGEGRLLSRGNFNMPKRKCLICNKDAVICSREKNHSYEEVLKKVDNLVDNYIEEKGL